MLNNLRFRLINSDDPYSFHALLSQGVEKSDIPFSYRLARYFFLENFFYKKKLNFENSKNFILNFFLTTNERNDTMIRFANPASDINIIIKIFKMLHNELYLHNFSLDDIANILSKNSLASSCGFSGIKALELSLRKDRSKDPLYNQSKSYCELFRNLGWIKSTDSSLNFEFTYLGEHIAKANDYKVLFNECLISIRFPNENISVKFDIPSQPFLVILKLVYDLGYINKNEIILGPLNCPCTSNEEYNFIKDLILYSRKNKNIASLLKALGEEKNITITTMGNYTRFVMSALKYTGWFTFEKNNFYLTKQGLEFLQKFETFKFISLEKFKTLTEVEQKNFVKNSFFSFLKRCNYDISYSPYDNFFSPYAYINSKNCDSFLDYNPSTTKKNNVSQVSQIKTSYEPNFKVYDSFQKESRVIISQTEKKLKDLLEKHGTKTTIDIFYKEYSSANKDIFYNLIRDLFIICGQNCKISRAGDNNNRFDAIIESNLSIPIEIKSPAEEKNISVKAVRQALENKIILSSRCQFPSKFFVPSFVVGYDFPSERAEVFSLISDIKTAFNIDIHIFDFKTLLELAIDCINNNKIFNFVLGGENNA